MKNFAPLAFAALLPLAANASSPPPFICPQVAVLQQAQTVTQFLPGRADVAARVTTAQITGVSGACVLHAGKHSVMVTVNTEFLADNGPANNSAPLTLPWFAAITDGDNIIAKSNYSEKLSFDGNNSTASATGKPVKIELPDVSYTANMQILVGFQESPDQLAYTAAHPQAAP